MIISKNLASYELECITTLVNAFEEERIEWFVEKIGKVYKFKREGWIIYNECYTLEQTLCLMIKYFLGKGNK